MSQTVSAPTRASDFSVGQNVELTDEAVQRGMRGYANSTRGVVVAIREPLGVKVRPDGLKGARWFHCTFWTTPKPTVLRREFLKTLTALINEKAPELPEPKFTTSDVEQMVGIALRAADSGGGDQPNG